MQSPEHSNTLNITSLNDDLNKTLKLEAIDLLAKFNSSISNNALDKKQAKIDQVEIDQWQKQSSQHQQAWQAAEKMWLLMAEITLNAVTTNTKVIKQKNGYKHFMPISIAASLVLVLTLCLFNLPVDTLQNNTTASTKISPEKIVEKQYSNQWQAQHRVLLPDHSVVHLNFNSAIKISFSSTVRHIELLKGEAYFKVAKNPNRPFIVQVGNTSASALGTAFIVNRKSDNFSLITVTEGVVKVVVASAQQLINTLTKQEKTESSIILTVYFGYYFL